jgi:carbamoyltransferase
MGHSKTSGSSRPPVVGWFQDRMEFGPRALGPRSIIGDARSASMQAMMNVKIKFRESFQPFAPSVLNEDASEYFELDQPSPYMLLVANVLEKHRRSLDVKDKALMMSDTRLAQASQHRAFKNPGGDAR